MLEQLLSEVDVGPSRRLMAARIAGRYGREEPRMREVRRILVVGAPRVRSEPESLGADGRCGFDIDSPGLRRAAGAEPGRQIRTRERRSARYNVVDAQHVLVVVGDDDPPVIEPNGRGGVTHSGERDAAYDTRSDFPRRLVGPDGWTRA
jgi:hypothetical protein